MVITQNKCYHNNLFDNEQQRAVVKWEERKRENKKHCLKRLPLNSFLERSNFSLKYFNWIRDLIWGLEIKHMKAYKLCDKGVFSSIILSQLRRPAELKFSQVCYFMHFSRSSEKTGLWQLPIVSSVFTLNYQQAYSYLRNQWRREKPHCVCCKVPAS